MKTNSKIYNSIHYVFSIGIILLITCIDMIKSRHLCNIKDCKMYKTKIFSSKFEEGTDGYYFELTHWNHPKWSDEQCEDYIFSYK